MKLTCIIWDTYEKNLRSAAKKAGVDLDIYTFHDIEHNDDPQNLLRSSISNSDLILYYRSNAEFWKMALDTIAEFKDKKFASVGSDATYWKIENIDNEDAIKMYTYLINNGEENCYRLMLLIKGLITDDKSIILPPVDVPWQGIVHPDAGTKIFETLDEYLDWYNKDDDNPWVGIIASRSAWISDNCNNIEYPMIRMLESRNVNVITFFSMSIRNETRVSFNIADCINRYFIKNNKCVVSAIIKMASFLVGFSASGDYKNRVAITGSELLTKLNIPVFQPVMATRKSLKEWRETPGLTGDIAWMIAFPEFEGMIEPMMISASRLDDDSSYERTILPMELELVVDRVVKRVQMGKKQASERKVVFFLNNNPCSSVEANVGGASHLDTHESIANILKRMKKEGYNVNPPDSGKSLIMEIINHKAISEFRWTSVSEIDRCGGVIYKMPIEEYLEYFNKLPEEVKTNVIKTWGEPPGKSMVLNDEILITGICHGNVIIAVQPKRGCFGSRCDGEVCKILHDPLCPPTHQYIATYHYYEELWGADAIVHVGTHGNLEFLPGKNAGMSCNCYPIIGIGRTPHFYIYNSDNPPEGTVAKRRSMATLVDHMQCVMVGSSLYDDFSELDNLLEEYESACQDPSHAHQLHHLILDAVKRSNLKELNITNDTTLEDCVGVCHEALFRIRNSQMNLGMHIIGTVPTGDNRIDFINSILRYDSGTASIRDLIANMMCVDLTSMYEEQGGFNTKLGISNGATIELISKKARDMIGLMLSDANNDAILSKLCLDADEEQLSHIDEFRTKVKDISKSLDDTDEIGSLLNGFAGGFIPPGPSGLITRGRADILPTGRNFYSLDPTRIPTETAWRVGVLLANDLIDKYLEDTSAIPENVGFFWMSNDLLMANGEMMSQIMSLIGIKPVWANNGQLHGYSIIPLEDLGHPRIDVTIRISSILRDNFMNCVDIIDGAIKELAQLDEPVDLNYIKKHVQASIKLGANEGEATARFFSAPPGSYASGVNLAVLASAWKTDKDLSDIFIASNGYAYGNGRNGEALHEQFATNLSTINITYNKIASDEHDLFGCCCYFSTQGGMTISSKELSGNDVKTYYGDTREPKDIHVHTLADEIRRTVRTKLLNPRWIEGEKQHGYKGATDIMKTVTRVYGWQATTKEVDDWIFDDITSKFVNDDEMRGFFKENNPYALEEIARRMLEAEQRDLWKADPDVLNQLKDNYIEIESWMEELAGDGEYQSSNINIVTSEEIEPWGNNVSSIMKKVHTRMKYE